MSKLCISCGARVEDDKKFCTACGTRIGEEVIASPSGGESTSYGSSMGFSQPRSMDVDSMVKGTKYEPITTWGYIGIMLLMCIPLVGQVLMIVWALGGCRKVNKRSLARASLIMMAFGLLLSLILGVLIKGAVNKVQKELNEAIGIEGIREPEAKEEEKGSKGLIGLISGKVLEDNTSNSNVEELEELGETLNQLEKLTGEKNEGLDSLIEGAVKANQDAERINDGWPASLRKYPTGTMREVTSYRTEITGTSKEEMMAYIEELKSDGFAFQDFYEFGMTEEDMLGMNAWWATDGELYLSISFSEGTVLIDHTKELPDLESYFQ